MHRTVDFRLALRRRRSQRRESVALHRREATPKGGADRFGGSPGPEPVGDRIEGGFTTVFFLQRKLQKKLL
jgi:hypothetical protein